MRIYSKVEDTIKEWSRLLMIKHGSRFRIYGTTEETMKRWSEGLTAVYGKPFRLHDNIDETIVELEQKKLKNLLNIMDEYSKVNIGKRITSVEFKEGDIVKQGDIIGSQRK